MALFNKYAKLGRLAVAAVLAGSGCGDDATDAVHDSTDSGATTSVGSTGVPAPGTDGSGADESTSSGGGETGDSGTTGTGPAPVGDEPADRLFSVLAGQWQLQVEGPGCPALDCPGDDEFPLVGEGYDPVSYGLSSTELGTRYKPVGATFAAVEVGSSIGVVGGVSYYVLWRSRTDDLVLVPNIVASGYVGVPYQNYLPLLSHDELDDGTWQFVFPNLTLRFSTDGPVAGMDDPTAYPRRWFDEAVRTGDPDPIYFPDPYDEIFWGEDDDAKIALLQQAVAEQPHVNAPCTEGYTTFWPEVAWRFLQYDDPVVREDAVRMLLDLSNPMGWICTPRLIALDMLAGQLGTDPDPIVRTTVADGLYAMIDTGDLWYVPCEIQTALTECVRGDEEPGVQQACADALDRIDAVQPLVLACVETGTAGDDFGDGLTWTCARSCTASLTCGTVEDPQACIDACVADLGGESTLECTRVRMVEADCWATVPCEELATSVECDAFATTVAEVCQ